AVDAVNSLPDGTAPNETNAVAGTETPAGLLFYGRIRCSSGSSRGNGALIESPKSKVQSPKSPLTLALSPSDGERGKRRPEAPGSRRGNEALTEKAESRKQKFDQSLVTSATTVTNDFVSDSSWVCSDEKE